MRRRLAVAIRGLGVGSVQFGQVTPSGLANDNKFTTSGLTAGFDWRAAENFIAGFAIGYGGDRTDVGINGTRSSATSLSATAYASWKPFDTWFVDAMLGYGTISYDNRRFVTDDGSTADGTRRGTSWFGAISTGYDVRYGALKLTPYVRADFMQARLNEYSEQGATAALLTYGAMRFQTVAGAVGLRAGYDIPMSFGTVTPMARVRIPPGVRRRLQPAGLLHRPRRGNELDRGPGGVQSWHHQHQRGLARAKLQRHQRRARIRHVGGARQGAIRRPCARRCGWRSSACPSRAAEQRQRRPVGHDHQEHQHRDQPRPHRHGQLGDAHARIIEAT